MKLHNIIMFRQNIFSYIIELKIYSMMKSFGSSNRANLHNIKLNNVKLLSVVRALFTSMLGANILGSNPRSGTIFKVFSSNE